MEGKEREMEYGYVCIYKHMNNRVMECTLDSRLYKQKMLISKGKPKNITDKDCTTLNNIQDEEQKIISKDHT